MTKKNNRSTILRKKQKELIDEFILNPNLIKHILGSYRNKRGIFHNYSINNLILANFQLLERREEGIELLAPYKRWEKVNRNVKKGEKALYILAPIVKTIKDEETDEIIDKKVFFRSVPVFDISQTEGEPFEEEYVESNTNLSFEEVVSKVNVPVKTSEKILTRGYTDGKSIWVSENISDAHKICVLFHELAHYHLHFGEDRKELTSATKELEAEAVSFIVSSALGITNKEAGAYIVNWAGENSHELIKGKGSKLIKLATKIIDDLELNDNILDTTVKDNKATAKA